MGQNSLIRYINNKGIGDKIKTVDSYQTALTDGAEAGTHAVGNGVLMVSDGNHWFRPSFYTSTWNNLIGALGDSRLHNAGVGGVSENRGPLHWACMMSGQRLTFSTAYNFGVGGYTTADIVANTLDLACMSLPSSMFVLCGTNDRTSLTLAQTIANIETIVTKLVNSGKDVYIMAELPRGDTTNTSYRYSAAQLAAHVMVREYILNMRGRNNVFVCDAWNDTAVRTSTTGDIQLGITIDGLHPNAKGAYLAGKCIAAQIIARHPIAPSFTPVSNSQPNIWINANPILDGTAGNVVSASGGSGVMATSWTSGVGSTVGGITRTYSKTTEGYQQIVIGGTAGGSNPYADVIRQTGLNSIITANSYVYAVGELSVAAGQTNITGISVGIMVVYADASSHYVWDGDRYNDASIITTDAFSGVYKTQSILVPAGATEVRLILRVYGVSSAASTATITVKSLGMRYA